MEAVLGCRQAYISQHLAVLREAGIVEDRRDGWNIFYRVAKPEVYDLIDLAGQLMGQTKASSEPLRKPVNCPCPKCNPMPLVILSENSAVEAG
jgi:ArsR family transcriptional regulator